VALFFALGIFLIFREAPELGDDLDYWGLAFDLHAGVPDAWSAKSFHDYRWPVWGPLWAAQFIGLQGLLSYYAAPLLYFAGTALLVFGIARACRCDHWLSLAAVALYALHPYQDTVFSRPMPDLSEGFWAAGALFFWMRSGGKIPWLACAALCLAVAASNRITGVFAALALGVAVLICEPRRWRELAAVAGMTLAFVLIEWTIWACVTGDFLAVLHANLGGRGRAGTGPIPAWELPVRFLRYLWTDAWERVLTLLFALGIVASWRNAKARLVVVMVAAWWLAISCAVQGVDPVRPMLRTSGRFLAGLSPLLAIAGACGLAWLVAWIPNARVRVSWAVACAVLIAVITLNGRTTVRENFPEEIAQVVAETSAGRRVLADPPMQKLAMLCNESGARKLEWDIRKQMVVGTPELEAAARKVDEVWFFRSKIWNWVLADLRTGKLRTIPQLASYFGHLGKFWPRRVIAHGQVPEFHFLSRNGWKKPLVSSLLKDPLDLDKRSFPRGKWTSDVVQIAPDARGAICLLKLTSRSEDDEPLMAWIEFLRDGKIVQRLEFEPPGFPEDMVNAWFLQVPEEADAWRFRVQVRDVVHIDAVATAVAQPAQE
jgi:hypothetical protein